MLKDFAVVAVTTTNVDDVPAWAWVVASVLALFTVAYVVTLGVSAARGTVRLLCAIGRFFGPSSAAARAAERARTVEQGR